MPQYQRWSDVADSTYYIEGHTLHIFGKICVRIVVLFFHSTDSETINNKFNLFSPGKFNLLL